MSDRRAVRSGDLLWVLLRRSVPWALAAGLVCLVAFAVTSTRAAVLGSTLGVLVVLGFYGADLLVLRLTRHASGGATMSAFLGEYLVKVLLLAALLWGLHGDAGVDLQATAVTVVATTVVWVVAVTTASLRTRSFVLDQESTPGDSRSGGPRAEG